MNNGIPRTPKEKAELLEWLAAEGRRMARDEEIHIYGTGRGK